MADKPLSVSAYARRRGISHTAVQKRIAAGALPTSSKKIKGTWKIVNAARADQEWEAFTRPWVGAGAGPAGAGKGAAPSAMAEATLRERRARAWAMELEIGRKTRELVPAREVNVRWSALVVAARTAMLGLPSRAKQRIPHLTGADLGILEGLIREALEELAQDVPAPSVEAS